MAKQSIESMYDLMFKMRDKMGEVLQDAQELELAAKTYGGEISRVMSEQLTQYFGPTIQNLINDEKTPGAIVGLIRFMDSVPLAFTRVEPTLDETVVDPVDPIAPQNLDISKPITLGNDLDKLPRNASFATSVEDVKVPETLEETPESSFEESIISKKDPIKESFKYQVVRTSTCGSALGEEISNLKDSVVADFDDEDSAELRAKELNETVLPSEKELLGTEYKVIKKELLDSKEA